MKTASFILLPFFILIIGCNKNEFYKSGEIIKIENFPSRYVPARNIEIYLPPGYNKDMRCNVIYMHDGQNVFNPETSFTHVDWGIDETLDTLIQDNLIAPVIVVAIWNTPHRGSEYMPQKAADLMPPHVSALWKSHIDTVIYSDDYLRFLVHEVKPYVDAKYNTFTSPEHTAIMGSSMGALVSAYAVCEYPDVFGKAACLSTHWPAGDGVFIEYLKENLPATGQAEFYFDYGTLTLDAGYADYQDEANEMLKKHGYLEGIHFTSRKFEGADHSEKSWRNRMRTPLLFLFHSQ